ncbi:hypothetical protein B0J13DRAFT_277474 [Dactylonectria estremocensis]|uniref:Uncharacterized protein n=1 Tax=Dactylonectria estremocensis TaxID=1079267 RepID=A0A9P9J904_9HYPO|nr:hypothetical protein B0J13DRAFT_277474 [Dactylonectria estremocensis]
MAGRFAENQARRGEARQGDEREPRPGRRLARRINGLDIMRPALPMNGRLRTTRYDTSGCRNGYDQTTNTASEAKASFVLGVGRWTSTSTSNKQARQVQRGPRDGLRVELGRLVLRMHLHFRIDKTHGRHGSGIRETRPNEGPGWSGRKARCGERGWRAGERWSREKKETEMQCKWTTTKNETSRQTAGGEDDEENKKRGRRKGRRRQGGGGGGGDVKRSEVRRRVWEVW